MNPSNDRNALGLQLIGGFKLACGLLLVALGVGLLRNAKADPTEEVEHLVAALRLDPGNHYIHSAIATISGIKPTQLRAIGVGTFLYALLYLVEGVGLLLKKHWAEYLTAVATGLFIPLEIYEIARRVTPIRIGLLVINAAILVYVIEQIRRKGRKEAGASPAAPLPAHLTGGS